MFKNPRVGADGLSNVIGDVGATMLVVGGMIGVGIFVNPAVVARSLHDPGLVLIAWFAGGALALMGALVYAELAARMPLTGGEYVYLREAYGPMAGFLFGWTTLLVVQAGSLAAIAIVFAQNVNLMFGGGLYEPLIVAATLLVLALINCAGVAPGNSVQLGLGVLKVAMLTGLAGAALSITPHHQFLSKTLIAPATPPCEPIAKFSAGIIPIVFSYGGWQTANFVAGEIKNPQARLSRALVVGVCVVMLIYVLVNLAYLQVLGVSTLAASTHPLTGALSQAFGRLGGFCAAIAVGFSALAFMSQSMLTGPRVYFAMARDGLLPQRLAQASNISVAPVAAILLQAAWAEGLALSNSYEHLLHYVVGVNFLFFAASASSLFILRHRDQASNATKTKPIFFMSLHPWITIIFIASCLYVVLAVMVTDPMNSFIGYAIVLSGVPAFFYFRRTARHRKSSNRLASQ